MKHKLIHRIGLPALVPLLLFLSAGSLWAEMLQLSQFQSSIFHISPAYTEITPDRFKDDQYIDDDQADEFIKTAEVEIYLPADHDNYPYSVVDHFILDTDLVIITRHDSIFYPYPEALYLSRHNISITDYTGIKMPPEVYIRALTAAEPFQNRRVTAMSMQLTNYHVHQDEWYTESVSPGEEGTYTGHMVNGDVYSSGCVAVYK